MKRIIRRVLTSTGVLSMSLVAAGGCVDEETSMYVVSNLALSAPACVAQADESAERLLGGALDVGLRLNYVATLLVGNQLTPRGDKGNLRSESMHVTIRGAEVRLFNDDGSLNNEFTVPATGVVSPNGGEDPGFGLVTVTLIPRPTGAELATQFENAAQRRTLVADVSVFGETIGGLEVESSVFTFVIRVCRGCLVSFPSEALALDGACTQRLDQAGDLACRPGQDALTDCRNCLGNPFCAGLGE